MKILGPLSVRMKDFFPDIRAVLIPERKWHYIFHFLVMLVASSYWLGSLIKLPEATWAEIAMYRHRGDNQVYPVVAALSQMNLGDPTDALKQGEGVAGSQVVPLLPYAIAYRFFGAPGYMVGDVVLSWLYFVTLILLLRRCNFSNFSSLLMATAIGTRSLQILANKVGNSISALLSLSSLSGTWEWGFPDLLDMHVFLQRIPRPMGTELFLVLLLYFLIRQWHERTLPTIWRGLAMGVLMVLLLQGDPFSLAALGLLFLWVMGWTLGANGWKVPWRFLGGLCLGGLAFGWYFLWQRIFEHPDSVARFGMADYPRYRIWFLPGFGPLIRVGVVCLLAMLVVLAQRRFQKKSDGSVPIEKSVATFFVALLVAGYLAQPIQLLLLGKGSQIYHYLIFVLPTLYGYGLVILLFNFIKLSTAPELPGLFRRVALQAHWPERVLLVLLLGAQVLIGMENKVLMASSKTNSRQETNVPWAFVGDAYRVGFRDLEQQFLKNPALKEVRSFATFCYEVNFLLAGFHEKRAYLPDNAFSTLSDRELEDRLLEMVKLVQISPENFRLFAQANFVLNYFLGCAKYWMTTDYQYSFRENYTDDQWAEMSKQPKQTPWVLALPKSELARLAEKYNALLHEPVDPTNFPDAFIVGSEKSAGIIPNPQWYQEVYNGDIFSVYVKKKEFGQTPAGSPGM
jgi:hypothetical protein